MESNYIGQKIKFRDSLGDWNTGTLQEVFEELGNWIYRFRLEDGTLFDIGQNDITGIIQKEKAKVIPIKKLKLVRSK